MGTVKKWYKECEAAAYDSAFAGNPDAMFVLKSAYGYSEQPRRVEVIHASIDMQSREQIAERYTRFAEIGDGSGDENCV